MSKKPQVAALVLAGGAGRRVGGRDKGLLDHQGLPLVAWTTRLLAPQVDRLWISCNRNREDYALFGALAPPDLRPDFAGPLAGLEAAASVIEEPWLLVVPCDNPALPPDLVSRLLAPLWHAGGELDACWAHDGNRSQYLYCALQRQCLDGLTPFLDAGGRAVREWLAQLRGEAVDFSDRAGCFENLNTLPTREG